MIEVKLVNQRKSLKHFNEFENAREYAKEQARNTGRTHIVRDKRRTETYAYSKR